MDDETSWVTILIGWGIFILLILWTKWRDGAFRKKKASVSELTIPTDEPLFEEWTIVDTYPLTEEEKHHLSCLEIIKTDNGTLLVKFQTKTGASTLIPLAEDIKLDVGSKLDMDKVIVRKWKRLNHGKFDISFCQNCANQYYIQEYWDEFQK